MLQVNLQQLRLRLVSVALLLLVAACGTAETGSSSGAPAAQPTGAPAVTAAPASAGQPTAAPTQERGGSATSPTSSTAVGVSQGRAVNDQMSLIDTLRKAGANVQIGDSVEQPFMSVSGVQVTVNGADVQVFEYADEAAAQSDVATLNDTLAGRGTTMITWVASPHAYHSGRVLVLYVGDDAGVLKLLEGVMGAPVVELDVPARPAVTAVSGPTAGASKANEQVTDVQSLTDALLAGGMDIQPAGEVEQPFFDVPGTVLKVNGADVQVFEFADAGAAQDAVGQLGADGNPPTMIVDWVAPPHFYQAGRLVALYVGEDQVMTEALTRAMGPQVAGK
jgi:hypothetical protein